MWKKCFKTCCSCFQGLTVQKNPDTDASSTTTPPPPTVALHINIPGKYFMLKYFMMTSSRFDFTITTMHNALNRVQGVRSLFLFTTFGFMSI